VARAKERQHGPRPRKARRISICIHLCARTRVCNKQCRARLGEAAERAVGGHDEGQWSGHRAPLDEGGNLRGLEVAGVCGSTQPRPRACEVRLADRAVSLGKELSEAAPEAALGGPEGRLAGGHERRDDVGVRGVCAHCVRFRLRNILLRRQLIFRRRR